MTVPLPWSSSSLDDFINCPRSFHATRVEKRIARTQNEEAKWGEYVHKCFEIRQKHRTPLPRDLAMHEPLMAHLEAKPGQLWTEQKIALDRKLKPCGFFDPDVWYRGVIDYSRMHEQRALIVDYKTGKPHNKHKQLMTFALWCFLSDPLLQLVQAKYYWTTTFSTTQKVWSRDDMPTMWGELLPDLRQYVEAFKTDTWTPRPSGLCHGWCQVKDCEFWRPKRAR